MTEMLMYGSGMIMYATYDIADGKPKLTGLLLKVGSKSIELVDLLNCDERDFIISQLGILDR